MGAWHFTNYAYGATPQEAFGAAVNHALYDSGHGGYSGTISEKSDFGHVECEPRKLRALLKLLNEGRPHEDVEAARHDVKRREEYGADALGLGQTLHQAKRQLLAAEKREARFMAKVTKLGLTEAYERALALDRGDKWGPALCLGPVTGKLASEAQSYAVGVATSHKDGKWIMSKPRGKKLYRFSGYASS